MATPNVTPAQGIGPASGVQSSYRATFNKSAETVEKWAQDFFARVFTTYIPTIILSGVAIGGLLAGNKKVALIASLLLMPALRYKLKTAQPSPSASGEAPSVSAVVVDLPGASSSPVAQPAAGLVTPTPPAPSASLAPAAVASSPTPAEEPASPTVRGNRALLAELPIDAAAQPPKGQTPSPVSPSGERMGLAALSFAPAAESAAVAAQAPTPAAPPVPSPDSQTPQHGKARRLLNWWFGHK